MEKHKLQHTNSHSIMYPASSLWILASFGSEISDVILFSSPTFNKICCAIVCPTPCTYCMDVSMCFLFGISTPPIRAHWMTRLLNPKSHCLTKPITSQTKLKETAPQSKTTNFEIDKEFPFSEFSCHFG